MKTPLLGNSFAEVYPDLLDFWDYSANQSEGIDPRAIHFGTGTVKPHFICLRGHRFVCSPVRAKTHRREFCPRCASPSVADAYPEIAAHYWDLVRNGRTASQVKAKANGKFHFVCPSFGHTFITTLNNIPNQQKEFCPQCRLSKYNFAVQFPIMGAMWDYSKNPLNPYEIRPAKPGRFWFECPEGHSFATTLKAVKDYGQYCRVCCSQESQVEREVLTFVASLDGRRIGQIVRNSRKVITPYELDMYIPKLHKAIEINGDHWHSDEMISAKTANFNTAKEYHHVKKRLAEDRGIELAFVWAHDWTSHQELIKYALKKWLLDSITNPELSKLEGQKDKRCSRCYPLAR